MTNLDCPLSLHGSSSNQNKNKNDSPGLAGNVMFEKESSRY